MRIRARVLFPLLVAGVVGAAGNPDGRLYGVGAVALSLAEAGQQAPQPPPPTPAPVPANQPLPADGQQPQPPRIRTGINYVRVDVFVTDKGGQPVLDLTKDDFTLAEDNKPQTIDAFSVVKIDSVATAVESGPPRPIRNDFDEEREAQRPDVRLFVILLDDYHVRRGNDMSVRKPLIEFVQNQLAPADMVAIMYPLTPVTDLRFSRDRDATIRAISAFEGRKFDYRPRNMFEEQYAMYPASVVERVRNQVAMDALKGAAVKMGGLREGRKSIIYVSEGLTTMLPAQLNDPNASQPGMNNPYRGRTNVPQPTDMQMLTATADLNSDMQRVFSELNRQNTSIYAVDPRGLAVFEYGINEAVGLQQDATGLRMSLDTLHVLANNTDGRAIVNRNDLAAGMQQIIRDSSGYYLLGYNSTQAPTDGKFHGIKVNVKRRGLDVRARKGYWAYTTEDVARATAIASKPEAPTAVTSALKDLAAPARDRSAHFWIGTARGENGATRVTFLWEPAPVIPGQPVENPAARVVADGPLAGRPSALSRTGARTAGDPGRRAGGRRRRGRRHQLRRAARPPRASHGRRREPRAGDRLGLAGADGAGLHVRAGLVRHASRVPRALGAGAPGAEGEARCGADGRSRVQPDRPPAHSVRRLRTRRSDPGCQRTSAEPRRRLDVESAGADTAGAVSGDRPSAVRARRRRVPDRAEREDRVGHGSGADRVPGGAVGRGDSRRRTPQKPTPKPRGSYQRGELRRDFRPRHFGNFGSLDLWEFATRTSRASW